MRESCGMWEGNCGYKLMFSEEWYRKRIISGIQELLCEANSRCKGLIQFHLLEKEEQNKINVYFGGGADVRLDRNEYINYSFTIAATKADSGEYLARTSIFASDREVYKNEYFWLLDEEKRVLRKFYLMELEDRIGDCSFTLGFTEFTPFLRDNYVNVYTYKIVGTYVKIVKFLLETDCFIHVEPCGVLNVIDNKNEPKAVIELNDWIRQKLGGVAKESRASLSLAKKMNMSKMDVFFHCQTLGPVYFANLK